MCTYCFFFNDTATTEIYTLSLHDALPISLVRFWLGRDVILVEGGRPREPHTVEAVLVPLRRPVGPVRGVRRHHGHPGLVPVAPYEVLGLFPEEVRLVLLARKGLPLAVGVHLV